MIESTLPVIVAYDGSPDARRALAWADEYAQVHDAPLEVLIVQGDLDRLSDWAGRWEADQAAEWQGHAREFLDQAGRPDVPVNTRAGRPVEVIVDASRTAQAVVIGSRGHGPVAELLMGSVSHQVARHAQCPVVVVRAAHRLDSTRIVVGVDGSAGSRDAVEFALEHAKRTGGSVTAMHGWHPAALDVLALDGEVAAEGEYSEAGLASEVMAESVRGLDKDYPDVPLHQQAMPVPPVRLLCDASRDAALVVVGAEGRGAFAEMVLGSVSAGVLHHAHCPVAVIR